MTDMQIVLNHFENENYMIFIEEVSGDGYKFHLLFKDQVGINDMVKGILHAHIGRQIAQEVSTQDSFDIYGIYF